MGAPQLQKTRELFFKAANTVFRIDTDGAVDFFFVFLRLEKDDGRPYVYYSSSMETACVCGTGVCVCCRRNVVTSEGLVFLFGRREEEKKNIGAIKQTEFTHLPHLSVRPVRPSAASPLPTSPH